MASAAGTAAAAAAEPTTLTPWTEKYRPQTVLDVRAQDEAVTVLSKMLSSNAHNLPHMLFYGPPGTGKTSTILALARQLYGPSGLKGRLLELNASDERGIDVVREKVKTFAKLSVNAAGTTHATNGHSSPPPFKIIILDEADSMTADAQSALRRIMETHSKVTRFCLICNYVSRIIEPLASRCAKLRFKPIALASITTQLSYICDQEQLGYDPHALEYLATACGGDMRRAITLLQSIKRIAGTGRVTRALVAETAGVIPEPVMTSVLQAWQSRNVEQLETQLATLIRLGYSGTQFVNQLLDTLATNAHLTERHKSRVALLLGQTDRALVDGADEHLQVLRLLITTMA